MTMTPAIRVDHTTSSSIDNPNTLRSTWFEISMFPLASRCTAPITGVTPPEDGRDHAGQESRLVSTRPRGTEAHGRDQEQQGQHDRRGDAESTEGAGRQGSGPPLRPRGASGGPPTCPPSAC